MGWPQASCLEGLYIALCTSFIDPEVRLSQMSPPPNTTQYCPQAVLGQYLFTPTSSAAVSGVHADRQLRPCLPVQKYHHRTGQLKLIGLAPYILYRLRAVIGKEKSHYKDEEAV